MRYFWCVLLGVLLAGFVGYVGMDYWKAEPVVINRVKTDTLFVSGAPDTVYKKQVEFKQIKKVLMDTVYITSRPLSTDSSVPLAFDEDTLLKDIFVSEKSYKQLYVESFVRAYAMCAVDSFECQNVVRWNSYFIDQVYPVYRQEFIRQRKRGRYEGALVCLGVCLVTVLLAK